MLQEASAARVAQADQKGWTAFTKDVQKAIRSLVLPGSDTKKPTRSNAQMSGFFQKLAAAKGRNQVK
jgi:hypothetical protein